MREKKVYSKVISLEFFCKFFLGLVAGSNDVMRGMFMKFKEGKVKIKGNAKIRGRAKNGGFFATKRSEFERVEKEWFYSLWVGQDDKMFKRSEAFIIASTIGVSMPVCNDLLVIHFWALDNEVRKPTIEDACGNMNWVSGGRTKNLITGSTDDGVKEVVIKPLSLIDRIIGVDYIGHINYNL